MKTTKHNITNTAEPIKPGYKKTPVGIIPEDWEVKELGNLCEDICGEYGANKSAIPYSTDLPRYVRITDINDEGNLHFDSKASANLSLEEEKKFKLEHHDLLFARTGATVGKSYLHRNETDEKFVYAGFLIRFRLCPNKVNPIFIKGYTDTSKYWHWVKTYSARSGQPGLNSNEYKSLKLPIPPLPEQKAIADCLSTWDSGIEKLTQLIQTKKLRKKGLMQQILIGKKRLAGFDGKWKEVRLGEIAYCLDNLRVPLNSEERDKMKGEIPYCGANGVIDYVNDFVIDDDIILMAEDGGYFDEYETRPIAYRMKGKCWVNNHAHILKAKENFNHSFLFYSLVHKNVIPYISGGTRAKLNKKHLLQIKINAPVDSEEQTAIAEILQTADKEIELLEKRLEAFKIQKKGLMQVLLTGTKRLV